MGRKSREIREARFDMTDYVIHFTRERRFDASDPVIKKRQGLRGAFRVLMEILDDGVIRPTFAPLPNRQRMSINRTIPGPYPAVCFTEQPISAILQTNQ